jgi:hypothetical protein
MAAIALTPEVTSKISDGSHDGQGQACKFYFIGSRYGIKTYRRKGIRDNMFLLQRFFSNFGLCPKVYNQIDVASRYGFVTELCDIMDTIAHDYSVIVPDVEGSRYGEKVTYKKYSTPVYDLEKAVQKQFPFIRVYDSHGGNFGFNYETGELNFVDVGHWEAQDKDGYWRHLEELEMDDLLETFDFHGYDLREENGGA